MLLKRTGLSAYLTALAFFGASCSREVVPSLENQPVMIALQIDEEAMYTRAEEGSSSTAEKINYENTLEVKLTASSGGFDWKRIPLQAGTDQSKILYIYDVIHPSLLEIRANGGQASYSSLENQIDYKDYSDPKNQDEDPNNDVRLSKRLADISASIVPLYGATTDFQPSGESISDAENQKIYQKVEAHIQMAIPVSRIEISGICYGIENGSVSRFQTLHLTGLYLDGAVIQPTEAVSYENGTYPTRQHLSESSPYDWTAAKQNQQAVLIDLPEKDQILNFMEPDIFYPGTSETCYAFNIFSHEKGGKGKDNSLPSLKFYFTGVIGRDGTPSNDQYAFIKEYRNQEGLEISTFEAGKIYQIKHLAITDKNFSADHTGGSHIVASVRVKDWTVVEATIDFTE